MRALNYENSKCMRLQFNLSSKKGEQIEVSPWNTVSCFKAFVQFTTNRGKCCESFVASITEC